MNKPHMSIIKWIKEILHIYPPEKKQYPVTGYKRTRRRRKHHKTRIRGKPAFICYCKKCHRNKLFRETKGRQYLCEKCGWRDPDDF